MDSFTMLNQQAINMEKDINNKFNMILAQLKGGQGVAPAAMANPPSAASNHAGSSSSANSGTGLQ